MCPASNSSGGRTSTRTDVAAAQPLPQLLAPDALDLLAEIVASGALDLASCAAEASRSVSQTARASIAGEGVADPGALAPAVDQPGGVQRLQVLGGVRGRLAAGRGPARRRCAVPGRAGRAVSSRRGLASALPITAIASKSASLVRVGCILHHLDYSSDHLIDLSSA